MKTKTTAVTCNSKNFHAMKIFDALHFSSMPVNSFNGISEQRLNVL